MSEYERNFGDRAESSPEMISNQFDAEKKSVVEHLDGASDARKEAIDDMANQVKKPDDHQA